MDDDVEHVEVTSVEVLHAWLAEHHADRTRAVLVRWKKGRGPYVAYPDLVRVLLSFGWIDTTALVRSAWCSASQACSTSTEVTSTRSTSSSTGPMLRSGRPPDTPPTRQFCSDTPGLLLHE